VGAAWGVGPRVGCVLCLPAPGGCATLGCAVLVPGAGHCFLVNVAFFTETTSYLPPLLPRPGRASRGHDVHAGYSPGAGGARDLFPAFGP